jgi:hypothetical protein
MQGHFQVLLSTKSSSGRSMQLWQMAKSIDAFFQQFLSIQDHELYHLCFVSVTGLCRLLVCTLCESGVGAARAGHTRVNLGEPTEHQKSEAQFIVDEIDYHHTISYPLQKFELWSPWLSPEEREREKDVVCQYTAKLRTYGHWCSKETSRVFGIDIQGIQAASAVPGDESGSHQRKLLATA